MAKIVWRNEEGNCLFQFKYMNVSCLVTDGEVFKWTWVSTLTIVQSPLHLVSWKGESEILEILLQKGAYVNEKDVRNEKYLSMKIFSLSFFLIVIAIISDFIFFIRMEFVADLFLFFFLTYTYIVVSNTIDGL